MDIIKQKNRLIIIDALRGFSLAGVAIAHIVEQYIAGPPMEGLQETANQGLIDGIVSGFLGIFITGKFFSLFSILFGLSFFIQMDSAEQKGKSFGGRFLWRAILLFIIGYAHHLLYRGDILTIYAVLVPFLIPFHKVSTKWLCC